MANFYKNFRKISNNLIFFLTSLKYCTDTVLRNSFLPKGMIKKLTRYPPPRKLKKSTRQSDPNNSMNIFNHPDLTSVIEIIKNKFYFATVNPGKRDPKSTPNIYYFNTDNHLTYDNFYDDFGPLNIACLYKYCCGVNQILSDPGLNLVVHLTSSNPEIRANATYLIASYSVLYLERKPSEVYKLFTNNDVGLTLKPFQDVSIGASHYTINLLDCLNALSKLSTLGFFDFNDFDIKEYEKYEKYRNGDLNWIIPNKFIAFLGPSTEPGTALHYPEKYLNYFLKNNVAAVVRLNRRNYESFRFTRAGILHYDMFFPDGTVPPRKILRQFLHLAETTAGPLAVHCKAGLGRTGTLIAAYLMKHYSLEAHEAIAWLRICRPGSVIGHQQLWLEQLEHSLWYEGRRFRLKNYGKENLLIRHNRGIYSLAANLERKTKLSYLRGRTSFEPEDPKSQRSGSSRSRIDLNERRAASLGRAAVSQGDKLNEIKLQRNVVKRIDKR